MLPVDRVLHHLERVPGATSTEDDSEWVYRGNESAITSLGAVDTERRLEPAANTGLPVDDRALEESFGSDPVFEIPPEITENDLTTALGGLDGEKVRARIKLEGIDALAWYLSFRYRRLRQWGIYIPVSSVLYVWKTHFAAVAKAELSIQLQLAAKALVRHELMHFAVDYAIAQIELIAQRPFYLRIKRFQKDSAFEEFGVRYFPKEEAVANAYLIHSFARGPRSMIVPGALQAAKQLVDRTPDLGYREGLRIHRDGRFDHFAREILELLVDPLRGDVDPWMFGADLCALFPPLPRLDARYCPIHFLQDQDQFQLPEFGIFFMPALVGIEETENFQRSLRGLGPDIGRRWGKTKTMLQRTTQAQGLDFKHWPMGGSGMYSVRVSDSVRAHLTRSPPGVAWKAIEIGGHKEMGHG